MPRCLLPRCLLLSSNLFPSSPILSSSLLFSASPLHLRTSAFAFLLPRPPPSFPPLCLPPRSKDRHPDATHFFPLVPSAKCPVPFSPSIPHLCAKIATNPFSTCPHPNTRQTSGMTTATLKPTAPDDQELLFLWFTSDDAITAICRDHNMTLRQIAAWAKRPDIAETIATIRELHEDRAKLQLTLAAHDAILTLKFITTTEQPTNANEIARRAAEGILSRCHHLRPLGERMASRVVVKTPPAPTPPLSPSPSQPPSSTEGNEHPVTSTAKSDTSTSQEQALHALITTNTHRDPQPRRIAAKSSPRAATQPQADPELEPQHTSTAHARRLQPGTSLPSG